MSMITREEMISKMCEALVEFDSEKVRLRKTCPFCHKDGHTTLMHLNDDCPVLLARKILTEPVIEVGDVVKRVCNCSDGCAIEGGEWLVTYINISLYGIRPLYYEIDDQKGRRGRETAYPEDLTLVRKGAKP